MGAHIEWAIVLSDLELERESSEGAYSHSVEAEQGPYSGEGASIKRGTRSHKRVGRQPPLQGGVVHLTDRFSITEEARGITTTG